ncbi:MAG: FAD-binding oxidoreductase [Burkholderiaceae bacterium]|nr:FAD-binding oxidoreductase [Burkholderiaceae bacterium]
MSAPDPSLGAAISALPHPLVSALLELVGPAGVVVGADVCLRSTAGIVPEPLTARVLVRPQSVAEVSAVLALCHRTRTPVVTHGGLTGLVHGTQAGSDDVILSLERMNHIEEISSSQRVAMVQAGTPLQRMQEAAEAAQLFFPVDLGARGSATIGGLLSTNAGGNRVVRYGMMRESVLGVEAVLADGTVISSLNRVIKNNTGYDVKQLFIGAEGTLGVITRAVLRLRELPVGKPTALVALNSFDNVVGFMRHMDRNCAGLLSAFEVMWPDFYQLVTTPPANSRPPLAHGAGFYILADALGCDAALFEQALSSALEAGLIADASIAQSGKEIDALWQIRDDVGQMGRFGTPFAYDISLPLEDMESYASTLAESLAKAFATSHLWLYGHLADGNLHVVVQVEGAEESAHEAVDSLVYEPLAALRGAISAEHGIGLDKKKWLHVSRSATEIALMRSIKGALDPHGILNPGKLLP